MGIFCEINLHKPPTGVFVGTAGNVVSGTIKYAVDQETTFSTITMSLKGLGVICLEQTIYINGIAHQNRTYNKETYIDIDNVIKSEEKGKITPIGAYEIPFRFEIPHNVPPSVTYDKRGMRCRVICVIKYYVRIKFNQSGIMNFTKRFKTGITMASGFIPRLPTIPTIYGGHKKLTQLFTFNSNKVSIKANILNSVLKCGEKIEFNYELTNDTNLKINGVETKLVEVHNFFINPKKPIVKDVVVHGTESKTAAVKRGEVQEMQFETIIPPVLGSAEFSNIYSREYCVLITVCLPIPHKNYVLKIPVQIGNAIEENYVEGVHKGDENDSPPSYWESMNEYKSDKIELDEEESIGNESK